METDLFVYIISHITITGYKTKTTSAFKIHHKLSVVSSLNACPYPEPALTHLSTTASKLLQRLMCTGYRYALLIHWS